MVWLPRICRRWCGLERDARREPTTRGPGRLVYWRHTSRPTGRSAPMPALPSGTVTLLFTDIEGSTRLLHALGGERYAGVLAAHQRLLRASFAAHGGREVDTQGDAFFVAFPRAVDAVQAAVEAQRVLAAHPWPDGAEVRVRMGLHTGEPTSTGERYVGLAVHRAARVGPAAAGGQVLV